MNRCCGLDEKCPLIGYVSEHLGAMLAPLGRVIEPLGDTQLLGEAGG